MKGEVEYLVVTSEANKGEGNKRWVQTILLRFAKEEGAVKVCERASSSYTASTTSIALSNCVEADPRDLSRGGKEGRRKEAESQPSQSLIPHFRRREGAR